MRRRCNKEGEKEDLKEINRYKGRTSEKKGEGREEPEERGQILREEKTQKDLRRVYLTSQGREEQARSFLAGHEGEASSCRAEQHI